MQYVNLYRKYRPTSFKEIQGQEAIVKTLLNSIRNNTISQAYIFSGSKGIGKTSIAKIFARAINCLNPIDGDCCNECENCKLIKENKTVDIIELDAASNNGVEEVRKIIDSVNFLPAQLKYKVYIIDEAHMLTNSAWNALLKTIEEPPLHTIFIFATTEVNKIPATILSRCQNFQFSRMTDLDANKILEKVIKKEQINIDKQSKDKIIQLANGSARDLLSILDQMCLYTNKNIDSKSIDDIFGIVEIERKINFINLLSTSDLQELLKQIDDFANDGINFSIFVNDIINILLDKLIYLKTNSIDSLKILNDDSVNKINISANQIISLITIWQKIYTKIKTSADSKSIFLIGVFESIKIFDLSAQQVVVEQQKPVQVTHVKKQEQSETFDSNVPIFKFEVIQNKKPEITKQEVKKDKPVEQAKQENNSETKEISLTEIFNSIASNTTKEIRDKASSIINSIKDADELPASFNCLINAKKVIVASNNGVVLLFENKSDAFLLNKNYLLPSFQKEIVKYFNHPMYIIGFTKQEATDLANQYKQLSKKASELDISNLETVIDDNSSLASLAKKLFA